MRSKFCQIIMLCFLTTINVWAQTGKLYNTDNQLSSSLINCIYQDRDGFIWIGTRNGLNLYDGYQFRVFKKNDGYGLASDLISYISQTRNGQILIGLNNALQIYTNDRFRTVNTTDVDGHDIKCYVNCIYQRKNGDVLIGTSGHGILLMRDERNAKQISVCTDAARRVSTDDCIDFTRRMTEDDHGVLWIATQDKGVFSLKGKSLRTYQVDGVPNNSFMDICKDRQGNIYVASINNGLYKLDRAKNRLEHIAATGNLPIASLLMNSSGKILLGSNGYGLYIYDPVTNTMKADAYYSNETNLTHGKVFSLAEDNSGNVWMGLLQKGVFRQPTRTSLFEYIGYKQGGKTPIGDACVMCVKYSKDGCLWVATDNNGIYILGRDGKLLKHLVPNGSKNSIPHTILGMSEGADGKMWLGSFLEGCGWTDCSSGIYHRLPCTYGKAGNVFDVAVDGAGNIWLGTMGDGLKKVDIKNNVVKEYRSNQNNGLVNDFIAQLYLSKDKSKLYIGTSIGLCCIDTHTDKWTKHLLDGISIASMQEDGCGNAWVGTPEGLYRINLSNWKIKKYTVENGLADDNVASIEVDRTGRIWISTSHGLSCLKPRDGKISNFYVGDGLQNNEFSEGTSTADNTGRIVFGGMGGITLFNSLKINHKKNRLPIFLTNFAIGGEIVVAGMKSGYYTVTDTTVMATRVFELNHLDNSFSMNFSTLTYDNPERITLLYSINGEKWVKLQQGKNEITFSHIPPGKYTFSVKAIDNNAESDIKQFTVIIHPAWYFSIWAEIVYAIILLLLILWYLRMRNRKEKDHLRLQEHIHAEEMSEAKLRFFMNISHEIRTPMTLIVAPLLTLIKDDKDPQRQGIYKTIKRNAERILSLINQMMDLRKIDKGMMVMRMGETDLIAFTADIYNLFAQQAKAKSISLKFEHDCDALNVWIDRGNFDKVLMNILSNAFKFTPSGGEITIRITHDEQLATIAVSDNGEKIPEDKLEKIFQRFYQTSSVTNDRQAGTGIGLDLTRSLVELHHGTITAANNADGNGCTFTVTILMGCAHLKPEEMATESSTDTDSPLYGIEEIPESEEDITIKVQQPLVFNKKRPTIVIVEDDTEIRTYLKDELSNEYTIIECGNGREALPVIQQKIPALVISDIMMPEMDGNTLCAKIKSNVNTNHIPVILLTAKSRDEDRLEGLETGADAYIVKPFNMDILRRTIINLLSARNLLRNKFSGAESQEKKVEEIQVKSPDERLLERVMSVINKNLDNSELSVDMIADEVGISRVHLYRKMKELTNQTPHDFIRNIRLKQAANLLANQHQNVTEVMYACGFNNSASFSTMFKNMYGMSPSKYMKEHLQMM